MHLEDAEQMVPVYQAQGHKFLGPLGTCHSFAAFGALLKILTAPGFVMALTVSALGGSVERRTA